MPETKQISDLTDLELMIALRDHIAQFDYYKNQIALLNREINIRRDALAESEKKQNRKI